MSKKSKNDETMQVVLPASQHDVHFQRNINSPLRGLDNTQHLAAGVGIDLKKSDTDVLGVNGASLPDIARDSMGRPLETAESTIYNNPNSDRVVKADDGLPTMTV